jgi:hypothetical protein
VLLVQHLEHFTLLNDEHSARRNRGSGPDANGLACQAAFTKEVARCQNGDDHWPNTGQRVAKITGQPFGFFPKGLPVSCRCHMNGEKNYKKRVKKEMRRKI